MALPVWHGIQAICAEYFFNPLYNESCKHAKRWPSRRRPCSSVCFRNSLPISIHQGSSMSDKFFFKGRQDARQHHTAYGGFQTNASQKSGSKKHPLKLVVTCEARKKEVEALVEEAQLHADITLDSSNGAVESIGELTAILSKGSTIKKQAKTPSRNDPCSCGSGLKFKKCCA